MSQGAEHWNIKSFCVWAAEGDRESLKLKNSEPQETIWDFNT